MTAFSIIEISHVALHIWDEVDPALLQLDLYTCGLLDLEIVFKHLQALDPIKVDYNSWIVKTALRLLVKDLS